jgi:signal transduction histidine kinase
MEESLQLALKGLQTPLSAINLKIDRHYDPAIGKVMLNTQSFSRGLINIINNGIDELDNPTKKLNSDFIPHITLTTKKLTSNIEIRIKDNGSGINPHIINKIFEPFFTTKPPGKGTGLGLSIAYDIIVNEHQGELKVESMMGEYTEFLIILPISSVIN